MPDAIPGRNQVIGGGQFPAADVRVVELNFWITLASQCNHLPGYINTYRGKPMAPQEFYEATAPATAHIQRSAAPLGERDGMFGHRHSIAAIKIIGRPELNNLVVSLVGFNRGRGRFGQSLRFPKYRTKRHLSADTDSKSF